MHVDVAAELVEAKRKFDQGRFKEAGNICEGILAHHPDDVRVLNFLGGSLARTGDIAQAIRVAEKVCALSPGNAVFYSNLSFLYSQAGNVPNAVLAMARAVTSEPGNKTCQLRFAQLSDQLEFYQSTPETEVIKDAIGICLGKPGLDVTAFSTAWQSLLLLEPGIVKIAARAQGGEFEAQAEGLDIGAFAQTLNDPFLLNGLSAMHATDTRLERVLTFLRRFFLYRIDECDAQTFLPFLCALAEHCHLNEYVFHCTDAERERFDALTVALDPATGLDAGVEASYALVSCYRNPEQMFEPGVVEKMASVSSNDAFRHMVDNTVTFPAKTREYRETISVMPDSPGHVQNAVSASVARQYAENPYPRWRHLHIPELNEQQRAKGRGRSILVAGCGTGFEPINLASLYPEARVLGVDLSVPSLAYGKQKAAEFGVENVEFMQADILALENLAQRFDYISCVGVLHHMEDPVAGWRKLLGCLKPDGLMKIALYSEMARKTVVSCRNWIAEQGIETSDRGIREFRQAIMDMDASSPMKEIMNWTDFYSTSMCRDLVFHVQEHRVTLPWIKATLEDLGLSCLSMRISNPVFKREYRARYPDDREVKNLDYLHDYEKHNPMTFRDMYQFWCCRKGSATAQRRPGWFYTS